MSEPLRVLHYLNQFFGGIGGEEFSNTPVQVKDGAIGPGRALQAALKDRATVVATLICGDDYVAENEVDASADMLSALDEIKPDLVVAGPAFDSGRYGLGCALISKVAKSKGIPAVTGMHTENAAVITHRRDLLAVPSGTGAAEMPQVLSKMAELGLKVASGQELGSAEEEGYIPTGVRRLVFKEKVGYERALDILLARVAGEPWRSEIQVQQYATVTPALPIEDLSQSTIAFVLSTGIVPRGNPDAIPGARALAAGRYSIEGIDSLTTEKWESVHGGFNTRILNTENPNYGMPLPTLRELEREGVIKGIYPYFFSTVGNQTAVGPAQEIGDRIAEELVAAGVGGVIQLSG